MADDPRGHREAVSLRGSAEVAPQGTPRHHGPPSVGIDPDLIHPAQVDDDASVNDGGPGHAVGSAAHRDLESFLGGEPHRSLHIHLIGAARDQQRAPVDAAVPDSAAVVVVAVTGTENLSTDAGPQTRDRTLGGLRHSAPPINFGPWDG